MNKVWAILWRTTLGIMVFVFSMSFSATLTGDHLYIWPTIISCVVTFLVILGTIKYKTKSPQPITVSSDSSNLITEVSTSPRRDLNGFGGWLILFSLGQLLYVYRAINTIFTDVLPTMQSDSWSALTDPQSDNYSVYWDMFVYTEIAQGIVIPALAVLIIFLTLNLNKHYRKAQITFIIFICVFTILGFFIQLGINDRYQDTIYESPYMNLIQMAVYSAVWIPYFLKSKRVTTTFVN